MMKKIVITAVVTGLFAVQVNAQSPERKYIDHANMDLSVKPGDNFYKYANGQWLKNNPVPASRTRWGCFDVLREESSHRIKSLIETALATKKPDHKTKIIADFYRSGVDSLRLEELGYTPIVPLLKDIDKIKTAKEVVTQAALLRMNGNVSPVFGLFVGADRKNVRQYATTISFSGTTMADRDYYLKNDARSTKIREAYKTYIQTLFKLIGENEAASAKSADAVLGIETALAASQYSRVESRDPYKTYNKFSVNDISTLTKHFNWKQLLPMMKINHVDSVILNNPGLLKKADSLLVNVPVENWKTYLKWNVLKTFAPFMSNAFVEADFAFTQVQTGQKQIIPRWQRVSSLLDSRLSDFVGQLYVEKYFKPEAKERMLDLVKNLETAFSERIKGLDWMSEETKLRALEKLNAIAKKIAYPNKWKTYDGIQISSKEFLNNIRSISNWNYNYLVNKLGKPVDRTEMGMSPPTVNASYSSTNNDITFPAGILQFPFFDFGADDAVNYGGIGSVIGHEITHGFDDNGRQFDAVGNLKNWWAAEDGEKFKAKADQVVQQYNKFTVLDSIHVNGKLTLGENIADLGGLNMAFDAFKKTAQYKENKLIDGFTPTQRFFLSWAQVWRNNILPENAAQLIITDTHSPGEHRGNGPVVNIDAWYEAFNVQPGDKLYKKPEDRIKIW